MSLSPEVENAIRTATRLALHDVLLSEEGQMLMERVATAAALHAIKDFMLTIGMDTTSAASILALQSDMQRLRGLNDLISSGWSKFVLTLVGILTTGGLALLAVGVKQYLNTP